MPNHFVNQPSSQLSGKAVTPLKMRATMNKPSTRRYFVISDIKQNATIPNYQSCSTHCIHAFDWQFINYYFHRFLGRNPFGFSGRRIGDLYAGMVKDASKATEWKKYRITAHTHNPVDDAKGNAEALKKFRKLGLKI
jgi:hypothetical protein